MLVIFGTRFGTPFKSVSKFAYEAGCTRQALFAPSAPKYRCCQADFFNDFFGSRETLREPLSASYFWDPFWDPSNLDEAVRNEAGCHRLRVFEAFSVTNTQTDKQTRTSYLGTGVAD